MTYTAPTAAQLRADIASTKRRMNDWLCEGRLDAKTEEEMILEIEELLEQLHEIESMEPVRAQRRAA
jgi:hypothetical protein